MDTPPPTFKLWAIAALRAMLLRLPEVEPDTDFASTWPSWMPLDGEDGEE